MAVFILPPFFVIMIVFNKFPVVFQQRLGKLLIPFICFGIPLFQGPFCYGTVHEPHDGRRINTRLGIQILQILFIRELRQRGRVVFITVIPFLFFIPLLNAGAVFCKGMPVNGRRRHAVLDGKTLIIIPRINTTHIRMRRILQTAPFAVFLRIPETV